MGRTIIVIMAACLLSGCGYVPPYSKPGVSQDQLKSDYYACNRKVSYQDNHLFASMFGLAGAAADSGSKQQDEALCMEKKGYQYTPR